ncbi:MAG: SCO family protein [bacterium]|nr:SCO family protein [Deltaproteobacteria bacterium]MCP4908530.1 SCO family protein [bacterium]
MGRGTRGIILGLVVCASGLAIGWPWISERSMATPDHIAEARSGDQAPQAGPEGLAFTDHTGRAVSERDFSGRYMLVFFGYTHCPDVCPGNLSIMSAAMRRLGRAAEAVQPVFITFDPARDTPEILAEYVRHFHPRLTGLTGTPAQIEAATRSYGVVFERADAGGGGEAADYSLRHTSQTYLIGPNGRGVAIFEHDSNPEEMASEILALLEQAPLRLTNGQSS